MATYSKQLLSATPGGGRAIKVVATASPGTTVHQTGVSATVIDEVWLWAYNSDTVDREVTVQFGGTTAPDDEMKFTVPAKIGWVPLVSGFPLTGTGAAVRTVAVYCAAAANVITAGGFVNRIG